MKLITLIMYIFVGLLFIGTSIPMILKIVPPNNIYGFRVRRTLENPAVWYQANWFLGWALLVAGILVILTAIALYYVPGLNDSMYAIATCAVMAVALVGATLLGFWYLRTITNG